MWRKTAILYNRHYWKVFFKKCEKSSSAFKCQAEGNQKMNLGILHFFFYNTVFVFPFWHTSPYSQNNFQIILKFLHYNLPFSFLKVEANKSLRNWCNKIILEVFSFLYNYIVLLPNYQNCKSIHTDKPWNLSSRKED